MHKYEFDFSKFNVGLWLALSNDSMQIKMGAIHQLTVGGVYDLPMNELNSVLTQFVAAYGEYVEQCNREGAGDSDSLRDMLDGIDGL